MELSVTTVKTVKMIFAMPMSFLSAEKIKKIFACSHLGGYHVGSNHHQLQHRTPMDLQCSITIKHDLNVSSVLQVNLHTVPGQDASIVQTILHV